jgi:mannosyltransferase OCH1-like enzyme
MRADVLRIVAITLFGGVYIDADEKCLRSLDELICEERAILYSVPARVGRGRRHLRDTEPNATIIRNGFIASPPRHPFFLRVRDKIFANIRTHESNNIWEVSGPGVINREWAASDQDIRSSLLILTRREMYRYVEVNWNHPYRTEEGHWSDQMKLRPIVDRTIL